jgi:hypothetical protein
MRWLSHWHIKEANVMQQMRVSGTEVDSAGFRIQAVGKRVSYRINATSRTHTGFQYGHVVSSLHEFKSGRQSGHPRTNNYHLLGFTRPLNLADVC